MEGKGRIGEREAGRKRERQRKKKKKKLAAGYLTHRIKHFHFIPIFCEVVVLVRIEPALASGVAASLYL